MNQYESKKTKVNMADKVPPTWKRISSGSKKFTSVNYVKSKNENLKDVSSLNPSGYTKLSLIFMSLI